MYGSVVLQAAGLQVESAALPVTKGRLHPEPQATAAPGIAVGGQVGGPEARPVVLLGPTGQDVDRAKGVLGGDLDLYNSYGQRSNLRPVEHAVQSLISLFPCFSRLRMLRTWGGVMDMSMDGSPIIGRTPLDNLYLNGGWCYGGFKATPASGLCFAHLIARGEPHPTAAAMRLDRFARGRMIDEKGVGAQPNLH